MAQYDISQVNKASEPPSAGLFSILDAIRQQLVENQDSLTKTASLLNPIRASVPLLTATEKTVETQSASSELGIQLLEVLNVLRAQQRFVDDLRYEVDRGFSG